MFNFDAKELQNGQTFIKVLVFIVYTAGAVFATISFTNEINAFFPDVAGWQNLAAHFGAYANLFSVLLMVWVKDTWVRGRGMFAVAVVGWAIEVGIMTLNTLAAFGSTWATWYAQLSPASPLFVMALWGTLWLVHPTSRQRQQALDWMVETQQTWQAELKRATKSQEVRDILTLGAQTAAKNFVEDSLDVVIDTTHKGRRKPTIASSQAPSEPAVASNGKGVYYNAAVPSVMPGTGGANQESDLPTSIIPPENFTRPQRSRKV